MRRLILLTLLCVMLLIAPVLATAQDTLPDHPEILWDTWGVPHIFSLTNEGLFYAFGWAQAHNHADLLLRLFGEARGRAAEYWGEDYLDSDIRIRTLGIPQEAADAYETLTGEWQTYTTAFASGINDYATAHLDEIGDEWETVLPVTPQDVMAHGIRSLRYTFVGGPGLRAAGRWSEDISGGSNAWAIAPSRSAGGNAMLVANPHQPWSGLGMLTEAHIVGPDYNIYGATLVGSPVVTIGFNDYLGWTHTVNTRDGWDLYQLTLTDDGGYLFDGETRAFDSHDEVLLIRGEDGTFTEQTLTVRVSVHGPVVAERPDGTALALRVVAENSFLAAVEWWEMGHAKNLTEFEAALRDIRIPMFTVMYADRDGNIMHLFNELVPVRSSGDWAFWNNTTLLDSSDPAIIPGDTSEYLWTEYHPYDDLPRVLNPESGWLQNANEPPWTTTIPLALDPADYPAYMLPPAYIIPRTTVSMRMLHDDPSITYDELVSYKFSTAVELARWVLDDLIVAARAGDSEILQQAADLLENWDGNANADSVGAVLFAAWANDYLSADVLAVPFDLNDPLNTPHGLADPAGAAAALEQVARQIEALRPLLGIGMDVPWGEVFRLRAGEYDLPANGAEDLLGTFSTVTSELDRDQRFKGRQGDSYVAVIEFGDPLRAQVLLTHGNSSQPGSPHLGDQFELFAAKQLRDVWRTREEIEAHLEAHEVFD